MHLPALIQDLAVILGVAAVVTFVFRRIKQPVVLGYVVAGIIVGPHTPEIFSVREPSSIQVWAELGVIFLMFGLGLEFSFRRLMRVGVSAVGTGLIQIVAMLVLGIVTANALGWAKMDAVFLGCMIAISSTTIIIKALEELGLKSKKFAELVFGILIVEDLAAILMLVALTNIATTAEVGGIALLTAGAKLLLVVGAWFLAGMFVVPRFVRAVSRHGTDEMLTVVAIGLCLALVTVAAFFNYSVALGAFIMGSILAESSEVKRIEHLTMPLKDIFGAVFFVSVGMMLDPHAILENWGPILAISGIIIFGKLASVTLGALVTGQTVRDSVKTGFSMAQIGEFSFIIATLGLSYGAISEKLYPIIVASSLITTFTTPYLIKSAAFVSDKVEAKLPQRVRTVLDNYATWSQRQNTGSERRKARLRAAMKWGLNAIVVIVLFTFAAGRLIPLAEGRLGVGMTARAAAWGIGFLPAAPSLWAMLTSTRLFGRLLTATLLGLLSLPFFPNFVTVGVTVVVCVTLLVIFRKQAETYYKWMESEFASGFQADDGHDTSRAKHLQRLAPWDARLVEVEVPAGSFVVGKQLVDLGLRERYGLNVVVVDRGGKSIVAPRAKEVVFPGDRLMCFATDAEVERFRTDLAAADHTGPASLDSYDMSRITVGPDSPLKGTSIRSSGIHERFGCIVVGIERGAERIRSPKSDLTLAQGDVVWVVGDAKNLRELARSP